MTALTIGLVITVAGVLADTVDVGHPAIKAGGTVALLALPAVIATHIAHARELAEAERAAARVEGYRLALQHLAAGLLKPPPAPTPDTPPRVPVLHLVPPLNYHEHHHPWRHAQ